MAQLKADFEALSLAIADLPVGLIPFPEVLAYWNTISCFLFMSRICVY